jgi:hypothetical protein
MDQEILLWEASAARLVGLRPSNRSIKRYNELDNNSNVTFHLIDCVVKFWGHTGAVVI